MRKILLVVGCLMLAAAVSTVATLVINRPDARRTDSQDAASANTKPERARPEADGIITKEEAVEIIEKRMRDAGASLHNYEAPVVEGSTGDSEWAVFFNGKPHANVKDVTFFVDRHTGEITLVHE